MNASIAPAAVKRQVGELQYPCLGGRGDWGWWEGTTVRYSGTTSSYLGGGVHMAFMASVYAGGRSDDTVDPKLPHPLLGGGTLSPTRMSKSPAWCSQSVSVKSTDSKSVLTSDVFIAVVAVLEAECTLFTATVAACTIRFPSDCHIHTYILSNADACVSIQVITHSCIFSYWFSTDFLSLLTCSLIIWVQIAIHSCSKGGICCHLLICIRIPSGTGHICNKYIWTNSSSKFAHLTRWKVFCHECHCLVKFIAN